jgi:Predicted transcriptional regulator
MSANSRLTIAIHVLMWMALVARKRSDPVTSDRIAASVNTHPVVIRRTLGLLQRNGLVRSRRGQNAGWTLARSPSEITLLDVFDAVEEGSLFALHHSQPNPACPIGRGIRPVLRKVYGSLEKSLRQHLSKITIEQVLAETVD